MDDDPPPTLNVSSVTVVEGDSGDRPMVFEVSLSAPSGASVTVQYATSNQTAIAGLDFTFALGTLTFPPGTTNRTLSVQVTGDTLLEADETFLVNLFNPVRATIGRLGVGKILDDDFKVVPAGLNGSGI